MKEFISAAIWCLQIARIELQGEEERDAPVPPQYELHVQEARKLIKDINDFRTLPRNEESDKKELYEKLRQRILAQKLPEFKEDENRLTSELDTQLVECLIVLRSILSDK